MFSHIVFSSFLTVGSRAVVFNLVFHCGGARLTAEEPARKPMVTPPMVVIVVLWHDVVMIMVHDSFADDVAKFVRLDVTMVMVVMDNVGVAVAINPSNSILIVVVGARSCASQHQRSDCEGTEECLFHERFGESMRQVIHCSVRNCAIVAPHPMMRTAIAICPKLHWENSETLRLLSLRLAVASLESLH